MTSPDYTGQTGSVAPPPGRAPDLPPHAPPQDGAAGQTGELGPPPGET